MPKMEEKVIHLCECGRYKHRKDANFCSICGRRIDWERKNALAEQIETLLEQWEQENN